MLKRFIVLFLVIGMMLFSTLGVFASEISIGDKVSDSLEGEVLAGLKPIGILRTATYMITGDGVRLRSEPSLSGTILGQLYEGDLVNAPHGSEEVSADGYNWLYVYSYNHSTWGWVVVDYLVEVG